MDVGPDVMTVCRTRTFLSLDHKRHKADHKKHKVKTNLYKLCASCGPDLFCAFCDLSEHDDDSESEVVLCAVKQARRVVVDLYRPDRDTASKRSRKPGLV